MLRATAKKVGPIVTELGKKVGEALIQGFNSALTIAGPMAMQAYEAVLEAIKAVWGQLEVLAPKALAFAQEGASHLAKAPYTTIHTTYTTIPSHICNPDPER